MKLSAFHKEKGDKVTLLGQYEGLSEFDKVYISKVFTDTDVPEEVLRLDNVQYGGTGFFYDKAPALPYEIEHHMPDYDLYTGSHIIDKISGGGTCLSYYTNYSIGFVTRGCFRKCEFCVNRNYDCAKLHSPIEEFLDVKRKKICLLDDNVLSHPQWRKILGSLQETGKRFQFKQGLDERLLTPEKCEVLFACKYDGQYIFAFDNIADYELIKSKLQLIRKYYESPCMFYVFCGFDRNGKYNGSFWYQDIVDIFRRIELLMEYKCLPYIMRFNRYVESPYKGVYVQLARWCNQPALFKKMSFYEFCQLRPSSKRYLDEFINDNPVFLRNCKKYITMKWR